MKSKVFLITGSSKGFGLHWAETALSHGHKVVATARNINDLESLTKQYGSSILPIQLDVTDRSCCIKAAEKAHTHFGSIDVLISNAGYGHFGFIEEITEPEARAQIDTNLFGSLWIIQAVLPYMRQQKSGHIIQVSSIGGVIAFPNLGIYHASKWAVEGMCESLSKEVAHHGINVTIVEPGPYTTDWAQVSSVRSVQMPEYADVRAAFIANTQSFDRGNPRATGSAIMEITNMENPPLRLMLGRMAWKVIEPVYEARLKTWQDWASLAASAHE
jgi:NADP-dependent 3-hydroxy acid dehydrogenase YdfG